MPDAILVRAAVPADAHRIASINTTCWREAYAHIIDPAILAARSVDDAAARWRAYLSRPEGELTVIVAEQAGRVLGFGSCGAQRDDALGADGLTGEITALYVDPSVQRRGIGAALLRALAAALAGQRHAGASLWVLDGNDIGRRFYEKLGGTLLPHRKVEARLGGVVERAYAWPDLTTLAPAPLHPIPQGVVTP